MVPRRQPSISSDRADSRAVAIAYVMQKVPYVFPIVGGRKVEHLHANLKALDIALTEAHIRKIESAVPFEAGAPHDLAVSLQRGGYPGCRDRH